MELPQHAKSGPLFPVTAALNCYAALIGRCCGFRRSFFTFKLSVRSEDREGGRKFGFEMPLLRASPRGRPAAGWLRPFRLRTRRELATIAWRRLTND